MKLKELLKRTGDHCERYGTYGTETSPLLVLTTNRKDYFDLEDYFVSSSVSGGLVIVEKRNPFYTITTPKEFTYTRHAWTGGDVPPEGYSYEIYNDLVEAFMLDQLADMGKLPLMESQYNILMNRARLDAWRTLHAGSK